MNYDILINEKGGTALAQGRDALESVLRDRLGGRIRSLHFASGPAIGDALETILHSEPEAVLIGGGDGTVALCGAVCVERSVPFGIIPLGTMNLLAGDLGVPAPLDECLTRYKNARLRHIDAGSVNGRFFFCNAIIGVVPEAAVAREEARELPGIGTWAALAETILRDMGTDNAETVHIRMRNLQRTIRAKSIIVANNAYAETPGAPAQRLARHSLEDGTLTVYTAAPRNVWQSLRLLARLWLGGWPKDPAIRSFQRTSMTLDAASRELLIALDGEPIALQLPFHFMVHPRAARVVVPA